MNQQAVVEVLLPPPDGEGDKTPSLHRKENVRIYRSQHILHDFSQVNDYMDNLIWVGSLRAKL